LGYRNPQNLLVSKRVKTAVLISGRGSNMVSLIKAAQDPGYPADIILVISNQTDAAGIDKARNLGVETICIDNGDFNTRRSFECKLHEVLTEHGIKLVCLAGFMRILTPWMTSKWAGRMINIHPSLLPKYKGLNTHERVLASGDPEHGCSVHWVTADLDGGEIIAQARIDVRPHDTVETLADQVMQQELTLYPSALDKAAREIFA